MMIATSRTRLRCWEQADREAFAAMHADPEVMDDYGGPIDRRTSDANLDHYAMVYSAPIRYRLATGPARVGAWIRRGRCTRCVGRCVRSHRAGLAPEAPPHRFNPCRSMIGASRPPPAFI